MNTKIKETSISKIDLNTIINPGMYYATWDHGCTNIPEPSQVEFYLKVLQIAAYRVQIYINCSSNAKIYIRGWQFNQSKYGIWKKFVLSDIN